MIRAGVIGLGVGEKHIAGYEADPGTTVAAICDRDPAKLAEVAERHPEPRTSTEPGELLSDPDIDVISVATYDDAHFEQVRTALAHGKHVFVEKPLTLYEDESRQIAALLRARPELRLSSNLPLRLSPRFLLVRELIARGDFGELFHMEGDYDYGRLHKLTGGWRGELPYYSAILGGAVHMIDLLLWLAGGPRVAEVTAAGNGVATRGTKFGSDSFVLLTLRFEGDLLAKVTTNLGAISPHFHGVRVYGTDATFVNGLPNGRIYRRGGTAGEIEEELVDAAYPGVEKGDLIGSFLSAIRGEGAAEVTEADVLATMAVCFAAERSLVDGRPIEVADL